MLLRVLKAEVLREARRTQRYWVEAGADLVLFTLGFLLLTGLFQLVARGNYSQEAILASAIGYLSWRVADGCMLRIAESFAEDALWGTLEQLLLSVTPPAMLLTARALVLLLAYTLRAAFIGIVLFAILPVRPTLSLGVIPLFLMTQVGVIGLAFVIAGLHLVYKNVSSLMVAISTALLFVSGALAPLENIRWLASASRLLPLTAGISILRAMTVDDLASSTLTMQPDFYWLLGVTVVYAALGWAAVSWGFRRARREGSLSHY